MRLRNIVEDKLMTGNTPVLNISKLFGRLIKLLYENKDLEKSPATLLLKSMFNKPDIRSWQAIKDKFIKEVMAIFNKDEKLKTEYKDVLDSLDDLSTFAPSVVVSSLFAIEPRYLNKTNLRAMSMSSIDRAKTMKALQPNGWVTTFSNTEGMPHSVLKNFNRSLGNNARSTERDLRKIYPDNRKNKF